jgi:CO/xanthine dehydrogenase FAD-binding subunit
LNIGSLVTHREIEKSELIRKQFSALTDAADVLGSIQIRNVATIGGNICTAAPSADMAPPLLALGSRLKLKSAKSERTIPIDQFFTGPGETVLAQGEILTGIEIPKPLPNTASAYWKHQRRQAWTFRSLESLVLFLNRERLPADLLCTTSYPTVLPSLEQRNSCARNQLLGCSSAPIRTKSRASFAEEDQR